MDVVKPQKPHDTSVVTPDKQQSEHDSLLNGISWLDLKPEEFEFLNTVQEHTHAGDQVDSSV